MKIPKGEVIAGPKERLTWDEMAERYPNQWVGLNDIKYENDDGTNIESAIVSEIGDRDVLLEHQINGKIAYSLYTTPDGVFPKDDGRPYEERFLEWLASCPMPLGALMTDADDLIRAISDSDR